MTIPTESVLYNPKRIPYPTVYNPAISDISLSYLSGVTQSTYLQSVTEAHNSRERTYQMFAKAYVSLMRKNVQRVSHIREHPIMIGIRKRQQLYELSKPLFPSVRDTIVKEFVELILHNPPHRVETLLLHSPLSLSDLFANSR